MVQRLRDALPARRRANGSPSGARLHDRRLPLQLHPVAQPERDRRVRARLHEVALRRDIDYNTTFQDLTQDGDERHRPRHAQRSRRRGGIDSLQVSDRGRRHQFTRASRARDLGERKGLHRQLLSEPRHPSEWVHRLEGLLSLLRRHRSFSDGGAAAGRSLPSAAERSRRSGRSGDHAAAGIHATPLERTSTASRWARWCGIRGGRRGCGWRTRSARVTYSWPATPRTCIRRPAARG